MPALKAKRASRKPPIYMSDVDYDRIAEMALRLEQRNPTLSKMLLDEIERAQVYPLDKLPNDAVRLGSEVEFADDNSGARRRVTLVLPPEADLDKGRISIMTPVGAGLIGMRPGHEINWPCPDGRPRTLKILSVSQPA